MLNSRKILDEQEINEKLRLLYEIDDILSAETASRAKPAFKEQTIVFLIYLTLIALAFKEGEILGFNRSTMEKTFLTALIAIAALSVFTIPAELKRYRLFDKEIQPARLKKINELLFKVGLEINTKNIRLHDLIPKIETAINNLESLKTYSFNLRLD